jgi:hypothetical protein
MALQNAQLCMNRFKPYIWLPIVAVILIVGFYFIFESGPIVSCSCGLNIFVATSGNDPDPVRYPAAQG